MPETAQPFLPFAKINLSEAAIEEVVSTLRSGWITTGAKVQKFEEMLSEYHTPTLALPLPGVGLGGGGRRALCVSSATAGLHIALLALGLQEGDEVITTPFTFVATLNTIVMAGGIPVLVDIDPKTLNIDASKIEAAITPKTKAIMPVHYAGLPCDMDEIYAIAKKHNLRVVEDAAHAIGAEYKGRKIGGFGDIQVMSFHPNKNMTTGEGGAITTEDAQLIHNLERLRFHGIDRDAFNRFGKTGSQQYDVVAAGFKYNMMDIQAALGIHQLPELDGFIAKRTALAHRYLEILSDWSELELSKTPNYTHKHAWHLFTPRLCKNAAGLDRDALITAMKTENIGLGLHWQSAHTFSFYADNYGFKPSDFPHALSAGERIFSLPLFPQMTIREQDRVIKSLGKVLGRD